MVIAFLKTSDDFKIFLREGKTKSQYKCVYWTPQSRKWRALICVNGKTHCGGYYLSDLDAAHAVNALCDAFEIPRKHKELGEPPKTNKVI